MLKEGITRTPVITKSEIAGIQALEKACHQTKNIVHKIDPGVLTENDNGVGCHLIYRESGKITGYMTLNCFDDEEIEVTAVVLENETAFAAMYQAALQKAAKKGAKRMLIIIDRKDTFVTRLAKDRGCRLSFTEYRMIFDARRFQAMPGCDVALVNAGEDDCEEIMRMDQDAFSDSDRSKESVNLEMQQLTKPDIAKVKMALLNGKIIGKIKIEENDGIVGIYGFVVHPELRRQGLGRKILNQALLSIKESDMCKDYKKIYLEVSAENTAALRLYETMGFNRQAAFDYYEYIL